ncbi:MAG: hypothetical protein ACP5SI_13000, partial [Chloroflexia bacterium]
MFPRFASRRTAIGLLVFVAAVLGDARAFELHTFWLPPRNLSGTPGRSTFPQVVHAAGEDVWAVWTEYSEDPGGEVWGRYRHQGEWEEALNLSCSVRRDEGPVLLADGTGAVHLAWTRRAPGEGSDIVYRRWDSDGWSAEQLLDHTATYHPSPYGLQLVIDASGRLCLYANQGSGTRHICQEDGAWGSWTPWLYLPGARRIGALVLGPDGLFHAPVFGRNEGGYFGCDPWLDDAYYTTTDGDVWSVPVNLSGVGSVAYDAALAFDGEGRLHFLWSDNSPLCSYDSQRSAVYERVLEGASWGPRTEVSTPNEGQAVQDLSLAGDTAGGLHLAWSEGVFAAGGAAVDLAIRYRRWQGGKWLAEEVVFASEEDSLNVEISVGFPD